MPQLAPAQMAWVTIWRKKYRLSSDDIAKKLHKMGYDVDPISLEEYFQNKGMLPDPDEPGAVPPPQAPLGQFITAMERDIETVLLSQLGSLGLTLYVAENGRNGQQYPAGEFGRIDLLTLDSNKDFVVIELKRDDAPRAVIGQIAGYIAFVKKTLATPKGNSVVGWIVARPSSPADDRVLEESAEAVGLRVKWYWMRLEFLTPPSAEIGQ
jgi:hypothetical protein